MDFSRYYRELARRNAERFNLPTADEARRDFQDVLDRTVGGMLVSR